MLNTIPLSSELATKLSQRFAEEDILTDAPRPDGFRPNYIPWDKIAARLDEVFGMAWGFTIQKSDFVNGTWIVHGRVTVKLRDDKGDLIEISKDGIGSSTMMQGDDYGDAAKGASSDALKRAAILLKVGIQLYTKEYRQQQIVTQNAQPQGEAMAQPFQLRAIRNMLAEYNYPEAHAAQGLQLQRLEDMNASTAAAIISRQHPMVQWLDQNCGRQGRAAPSLVQSNA